MKKTLKVLAIVALTLIILFLCLLLTFAIITGGAKLDENKLIKPSQTLVICDEDGNQITSVSLGGKESVKLADLDKNTVNAFIASEDRTFYKHGGLNYKRMVKALFKNIKSGSFKEGASTISQQLIKNTHLTGDKTIKRKLKEIKLTKQLESRYSKDEILEMYLNTIYFGHNCYGLQSAAHFYFDKPAEELTLTDSATIVGLLASPNNYSPFKNPEKCLTRRNIVLKAMRECGYISENEFESAKKSPLNAVKGGSGQYYGDYLDAVFDEIDNIDLNFYSLGNGDKIVTYLNSDMQEFIESLDYGCDNSVVVTDNRSGGVIAYKSTIGGAKRQPGSTIKPLVCYAPAIEEKQISPFTKIPDEKIDYNGYSPENFDKKYHGMVTVTESLKKSYNIPAVKTLNALTIAKAEKYLNLMGISLENDEKNLSLALGGMKYGLSLKELTDKYTVFADGGIYRPSRFVKEIVSDGGKTIYKSEAQKTRVFSDGTASLMNGMLEETAKTGTAKALNSLNFDVAAKTGTCGNSEGNTDAYAVGYTSENTVGVWLGDKDNARTDVTGGGEACDKLLKTLEKLYAEKIPAPLDTESGTATVKIDAGEYADNNRVILADDNSPLYNILSVKVLKGNEPVEKSNKFSKPQIKSPSISVKDNTVTIQLCQAMYYSYLIKRGLNGQFEQIYDGKWKESISDTPSGGRYTYTVTPYFKSGDKTFFGNEVVLPDVTVNASGSSPQVKIPDIIEKDWFDL